jgi:hypothetical protein
MTAEQVRAFRITAQQLDRDSGTLADTAILDLGVQDTGPDGARWALALRGVDVAAVPPDELVTLWTVRAAPHTYRRADLADVAAAVQPWSEADAAKRIFDASKPLRAAGIPVLTALDELADHLRQIVTGPMVKGDVSGALSSRVERPHLRDCVPCGVTHVWEMPFRLAATRAGLELEPGTSPPVLRPVPGLVPATAPVDRVDLVRACVRLLGPTTPKLVATYVDAPVRDVTARWPADVAEVVVDGSVRYVLAADAERLDPAPARGVRLLGPYDLFLQVRDREVLVTDRGRAAQLWSALGRPGAVLADGAVVGTWRPRRSGSRLTVTVELWEAAATTRTGIGEQAERLAAFRGLRLAAVDVSGT